MTGIDLVRAMSCTAVGLAALAVATVPARADIQTYTFVCRTLNNADQCATGESQLRMDVVHAGEQVLIGYDSAAAPVYLAPVKDEDQNEFGLVFRNIGPYASYIGEIYLEFWTAPPPLPTFIGFREPVGVDFKTAGVTPPSPPGIAFNVDWSSEADGSEGPNKGGIDAFEALGVLFQLGAGTDYAFILNALDSNISSEDMRAALHVKGLYPAGGSESFENSYVIPEPATILGLGTVLFLIGSRLGRKKAQGQ